VISVPALLLASVVGARSFLALILSASQEVVRGPPYRVRGTAYRIRDSAYRSRRGCFEDDDFVLLHARYRSAGGGGRATTHTRHCFLCGPQRFFILPEGYAKQLAALPIGESGKPLEPVHLLELRQGLPLTWHAAPSILSGVPSNVVTRAYMMLLLPPAPIPAG
jgi:hypothetical protein